MMTNKIAKFCFAACLVTSVVTVAGCGRPTEPTVIERPTEDFIESIRQGQAGYAASMKSDAKGKR